MNILRKIFKPIDKNNEQAFKHLVLYTFIGAFILNWIIFFYLLFHEPLFYNDGSSDVFLFNVIYLHAFLMAYVVYGGIVAFYNKKNKNIEVDSLRDYYSKLFKDVIPIIINSISSIVLMVILLVSSILLTLFTSGMLLTFVDFYTEYLFVGIIYSIYISYILIYLGLYTRNKITKESWKTTYIKYFANIVLFIIVICIVYFLFMNN